MFRSRPPIEDHVIDWIFETYAWLLREFGGMDELRSTRLVLPTSEFYPIEGLEGRDLAEELFLRTKEYARMLDWPCRLVEQESDDDVHALMSLIPSHGYERSSAAGTFSYEGRVPTVSYDPRGLAQPMRLVSTLAHELGHYLLAGASNDPPGGPDLEEPATDLAAVFMGFGIPMANGTFVASGVGWSREGYLGEGDLSYALAIFGELLDIDDKTIRPHLRPNPRAYVRQSRKHLLRERADDLEDLRRIDRSRASRGALRALDSGKGE
jgi:hypothetical protein